VNKELGAFAQDPALRVPHLEAQFEATGLSVQSIRDELLATERRVVEIAGQSPYAKLVEVRSRREQAEADCRREQIRMDALALLKETMLVTKDVILKAVSKPVQDRATSYLERVCGRPLASLRLTHDFCLDSLLPAEIDGWEESVRVEKMSVGEQEQIHLCTRLALAEELTRNERQFLILDDVLTATDDNRLPRICELLSEVASRMQVLLFTCHPERFASISAVNLIDMENLANPVSVGART
jgi:uncharacterized protein YhaN